MSPIDNQLATYGEQYYNQYMQQMWGVQAGVGQVGAGNIFGALPMPVPTPLQPETNTLLLLEEEL